MIDKIIASFRSRFTGNLPTTGNNGWLTATGNPGDFDIEILNSRDNPDAWGQPNVSRIIIGGTSAQLLVPPFAVAQSIDVGNFNREETAVVMLDFMLPAFSPIPRAATVPLVDVLTEAIGVIAAHEAGHFFGAWHTLNNNADNQVMDTGGNLAGLLGLGRDGIFGTPDDQRIMFGTDTYDPAASLVTNGRQDSAATIAAGLSTGTVGGTVSGRIYIDNNESRVFDAGDQVLGNMRVYADLNNNGIYEPGEPQSITRMDGSYILGFTPGTYVVRADMVPTPVYRVVAPVNNGYVVAMANGTVLTNQNFGVSVVNQSVTGFKFNDADGDGVYDPGESKMAGVWIYIDLDGDGRIDLGEPSARTGADGSYTLKFPAPGTYVIREIIEAGFVQTLPGAARDNSYVVTVTGNAAIDGPNLAGLNFGNRLFLDLGDAPASYGTLLANDGARHGFVPGLFLGTNWDAEQNGQPNATATGDDQNGPTDANNDVIDDEDGVAPAKQISRTEQNILAVDVTNTTNTAAYLHVWVDLNRDGDFLDSGEKVVNNFQVIDGIQAVPFPALAGALLGDTYMRVRLSQDRDLRPTGLSGSGEVEDYLITVVNTPTVAVNDFKEVSRNSTLNEIDVLANDFKFNGETLTIVSAGPSLAGAVIQRTADGKILYTPPNGFVGTDTFSYTVVNSANVTSTATVTVVVNLFFDNPQAIDDSFDVATDALSFPLNVLANDIEGRAGALNIISVTRPTLGGRVTIATGGQSLRYTPERGFGGTEQFEYTVADSSGKTSTATVTLHTLPGDFNDDEVSIKLVAADDQGNPISNIQQGKPFRIDVYVDDLRDDQGTIVASPGVFAAYLDLLYNLQLVSTVPSTGGRFDFAVDFFNNYTAVQLGDASIPGIIDDFGAVNPSLQQNTPNPVKMASIQFTARSPGLAVFKADPAEDPLAAVLLYDSQGTPKPIEQIRFEGTSIQIVGDSTVFPQAVDDTIRPNFIPTIANPSISLNVLANDRPGSTGAIRLTGISQLPTGGTATISNGQVVYIPNTGFTGTDSFVYTIEDTRGISSSATVTLRVGPEAVTNANDDILLDLEVWANGRKLDPANAADRLAVGQQFELRGYVKDNRPTLNAGVFAAYQDILYQANLVSPIANASPLGFNITYDFPGTDLDYTRVQSGDINTPGIINEVGAVQTGDAPYGTPRFQMFTIQMIANAVGTATFIGDPADVLPLHDSLLFQPPEPVAIDRIRYGFASVQIGGAGAGGEGNTNLMNAFDVNADGIVTPLDVLYVINAINAKGSTSVRSGEGESPRKLYLDVNKDGNVTPLDALWVINRINQRTSGSGEGESAPLVVVSNNMRASQGLTAEGEGLDDIVDQLAPEIESIWKRK